MTALEIASVFEEAGLRWDGHAQEAAGLFERGYNCSQSVFGAFAEECGVEFDTAMRLSSSFGGGMGRLREVCGALTGAFMVLGLTHGYSDPDDRDAKAAHYERIQNFARLFEARFGTYLCRDLLELDLKNDVPMPEARTLQYYLERPCALFVAYAAALLERELDNQ